MLKSRTFPDSEIGAFYNATSSMLKLLAKKAKGLILQENTSSVATQVYFRE